MNRLQAKMDREAGRLLRQGLAKGGTLFISATDDGVSGAFCNAESSRRRTAAGASPLEFLQEVFEQGVRRTCKGCGAAKRPSAFNDPTDPSSARTVCKACRAARARGDGPSAPGEREESPD